VGYDHRGELREVRGDAVKPYYERDGITIYHGDCREMLGDIRADVLVTDPPYGVGFQGKNTKHTSRAKQGYISGDDAEVGPHVVGIAIQSVIRGLVFPGVRMMFDYPKPYDVGCVYCPSGAGNGRWGWTVFHPVLFYGKAKTGGSTPAGMESFALAGETGHPCAKPVRWMLWAVEKASLQCEVVLDPFAGSGTTLAAAAVLGRRAIGIEIEERYCEIAAKRLSQRVMFGAQS